MELNEMTLEQKIGQLFVTGFDGPSVSDEFKYVVEKYKVGNVILFSNNVKDGCQLRSLCDELSEMIERYTGIVPFISADEEGGTVSRIPDDMGYLPSAAVIGQLSNKNDAYFSAKILGEKLRELGINFNLAPVLDINSNPKNPIIGIRSYGTDANKVAEYVKEVISGYEDANILTSGKHFPGHGDTETDSHVSLPIVHTTVKEQEEREWVPFRAAIEQNIPAITIAHIIADNIDDSGIPCTMSKNVVTDILRGQLGFDGMIISDCMEMDAIKEHFGIANGVIGALNAGIDLIFISHTPLEVENAIKEIYNALADGRLCEDTIDKAVSYILKAKSIIIPECERNHKTVQEDVNRLSDSYLNNVYARTVMEININKFKLGNNPLFIGVQHKDSAKVGDSAQKGYDVSKLLMNRFGGREVALSLEPKQKEIDQVKKEIPGSTAIVYASLNRDIFMGQTTVLNLISEYDIPTMHVTMQNPERENRDGIRNINLYEYSRRSVDLLCSYITKE